MHRRRLTRRHVVGSHADIMRIAMGWVVVGAGAFLGVSALLSWSVVDTGAGPVVGNIMAACLTALGAAMLWRQQPVGRWLAIALTCGAFAVTWVSYRIYEFRSMPATGGFIAPRT
jgi:hypothetical protein